MNEYDDREKWSDEWLISKLVMVYYDIPQGNSASHLWKEYESIRDALLKRMSAAPQDDEWEERELAKGEIMREGDIFCNGYREPLNKFWFGEKNDFCVAKVYRRVPKKKPQPEKPDMGDFCVAFNALHYNGDKPKTGKEAKTLSLQKWHIMKYYAEVEGMLIKDRGDATCGFCMLYSMGFCKECPIKQKTDKSGCDGTPYYDYAKARENCDLPGGIAAINAEIAFLESVEVEEEKPQVKFAIAGTPDADLPGVVVLELVDRSETITLHSKNIDGANMLIVNKLTGKVLRAPCVSERIGFPLDDQGRLVIE